MSQSQAQVSNTHEERSHPCEKCPEPLEKAPTFLDGQGPRLILSFYGHRSFTDIENANRLCWGVGVTYTLYRKANSRYRPLWMVSAQATHILMSQSPGF